MVKSSSSSSPKNSQPSSSSQESSCKYTGVRKRKWGKYVSEIRLPNSRERIWLGSYDTAEKAARAFDAALFCLRGANAKFNFPDNPPEISNGRSMTPAEIQVAAARFAKSDSIYPGRVDNLDSQSDSLSSSEMVQHVESPSPSVSCGLAQIGGETAEVPLDNTLADQFMTLGGNESSYNNFPDYGSFEGFDDYMGNHYIPPSPNADDYMGNHYVPPSPNAADYWQDNSEDLYSQSSFLWNF